MLKLYNLDNQFIEEVKTMPENFTGIIENSHKTKIWYKNGKCHRIDGPAIVFYKIKDDDWYTPEDVFYIEDQEIKASTIESFKLYVGLLKLKGLL